MTLFENKNFVAHSGESLTWKVECDSLNIYDWDWAAQRITDMYNVAQVVGIPTRGDFFADAIKQYLDPSGDTFLICDDVWTTGYSIHNMYDKHLTNANDLGLLIKGVVLFARNPITVHWVTALWHYGGK